MKNGIPPRVLHVCECLPGGPASYLREILPYQSCELGIENVAVLAPSAQMQFLGSSEPQICYTYRQEGRSLLAMIRLAVHIRRAILDFRPDILHLHSTLAGAVGRIMAISIRKRPKIIYCAHGWIIDPDRPVKWRKAAIWFEKLLSRKTDIIINISEHENHFIKHFRFSMEKIRLVVTGIAPKPQLHTTHAPTQCTSVLFIGRLDYQKGYDRLVSAAKLIPPGIARITVIGEAVRGNTGLIETNSSIEYRGWLPREEVEDAMNHADVIVMPSRWEGLPLVALEAMRASKPVIATNRGAFGFVIENGVTGLLVDTSNPEFLANVLAQYPPEKLRDMGQRARRSFEQNFTADKMNKSILELYHCLQIAAEGSAGETTQ